MASEISFYGPGANSFAEELNGRCFLQFALDAGTFPANVAVVEILQQPTNSLGLAFGSPVVLFRSELKLDGDDPRTARCWLPKSMDVDQLWRLYVRVAPGGLADRQRAE